MLSHHRISVNGVDVHYVDAGSGPLVVLLHGFPEFWYSWRKQIPALAAAGFRVVAPDLRGYNESSKPQHVDEYRLKTIAGDIAALIEQLGAPCVLVGHDWGAIVAWAVAMMRPELLRKLVAMQIPHPAPLLRNIRRSTRQKLKLLYQLWFQPPLLPELTIPILMPLLLRRMGRFTSEDIATYRKSWRGFDTRRAMANYYRALRRFRREIRDLMQPVRVPTLFIWSEHEPVVMREATEDWDEWVPDLRIARVAGAGHFVQTDQPDIVNELLIEFAS